MLRLLRSPALAHKSFKFHSTRQLSSFRTVCNHLVPEPQHGFTDRSFQFDKTTCRFYSMEQPQPASGQPSGIPQQPESRVEKLKRAVKDYGATVIVFHVTLSIASLGICYSAVASGIDIPSLLAAIGIGGDILQSKLATGASTFVVAYAVHKVFAPVRIGITLACVPWIVRYLRRVGILKAPKV